MPGQNKTLTRILHYDGQRNIFDEPQAIAKIFAASLPNSSLDLTNNEVKKP
jgi:hypothetical protein